MERERKRTQRDYTLAFKLAVVEAVEKGELTYKQAQRKYGIQGRSTVLVRDLPIFDYRVVLHVPRRRVWCDQCGGPRLERLDWLGRYQRV
ncbi:transposase family protein, partial [Cupriavidus gilardii]